MVETPAECVRFCELLEELLDAEWATVTVLGEVDVRDGPNHTVDCCGVWTDCEDRRFSGDTRLECLEAAAEAKRTAPANR